MQETIIAAIIIPKNNRNGNNRNTGVIGIIAARNKFSVCQQKCHYKDKLNLQWKDICTNLFIITNGKKFYNVFISHIISQAVLIHLKQFRIIFSNIPKHKKILS